MSANEVVEGARDRLLRLRSWSIENRLREWVAALLAVSAFGMGIPLLFDSETQAHTLTFLHMADEMQLYWPGLGFLVGGLLVLSGFASEKDAPNGFAFAGGILLTFLYAGVALSVAYAVLDGAASTHVSMYSTGCLMAVMIAYLYRTRRK